MEAAAQQGKFEAMHAHVYERQTEWGHTSEDRSPVFRGYAKDLGLDMDAYDAAIADPATMERVNADKADDMALNIEGTPTFLLDAEKIQPATLEEFRSLIEPPSRTRTMAHTTGGLGSTPGTAPESAGLLT